MPHLSARLHRLIRPALIVAAFGCPSSSAADLPPVIRSAHSGPWSAADTWEGGKVPAAGARVQIRHRPRVVYDVQVRRGRSAPSTSPAR